jgi:methyl-accepting chemotaxis protein
MLKKIKDSIDHITRSSNEVLARFEAIDTGVKIVSEHEHNIRNAMEEQKAGERMILESISRLNDITASVKTSSKDMTEAGEALVNETSDLMKISHETVGAMTEMAEGVSQINIAVNEINNMSTQNKTNIDTLEHEMGKFTTS